MALPVPTSASPVFLSSVSCPTATFCAAVGYGYDNDYGNSYDFAYTWNGKAWSGPTTVDNGEEGLFSVSCTASTFCVAVGQTNDGGNYAITFDGRTWSKPTQIAQPDSGGLLSVSCATPKFCITVAGYATAGLSRAHGYYDVWNGTPWETGELIDQTAGLTSVSCPTASFCMAVDANTVGSGGNAYIWNGTSWSGPTVVDPAEVGAENGFAALHSVSCPTSSFCMAGGNGGNAYVWSGGSWSSRTTVDRQYLEEGLQALSCPTTTFCMAVDSDADTSTASGTSDRAFTWNGAVWSAPTLVSPKETDVTSVSCPASTFCMAVDGAGTAIQWERR